MGGGKGESGGISPMWTREGSTALPFAWARGIQREVARVTSRREPIDTRGIKRVGGADASYSGDSAAACVVVVEYLTLREEVRAVATLRAPVPYVPGYFAFREIPVLLAAFRLLPKLPDVVLVHGHGYAHPRRAGIATHLGVVLGVPTIGIACSPLRGMDAGLPGNARGAISAITMGGEVVGVFLRPGEGKKPVCVSAGYRISLPAAIDVVTRCTRDHRVPEPLFLADLHARRFLDAVHRARERGGGEGRRPSTE